MTARFLVVQGRQAADAPRQRLEAAGCTVRQGFALPPTPWDVTDREWLCIGPVTDRDLLQAAVLAAARGAAVLAICSDPTIREELVADLARIDEVEIIASAPDPLDVLDEDQRAIVEALAAGASLAEAAEARFVSLRTAERRLATARTRLGVSTTAEAVALVRLAR